MKGTCGDRAVSDDAVAVTIPVLLRCSYVASMLARRYPGAAARIGYLTEPGIWLCLVGRVGWESE